jgi:hypothetical protein
MLTAFRRSNCVLHTEIWFLTVPNYVLPCSSQWLSQCLAVFAERVSRSSGNSKRFYIKCSIRVRSENLLSFAGILAASTCPARRPPTLQPWRRVDLSPERVVDSDVPACLPRAMLSCEGEWTHLPDRNLADNESVNSNLSILLKLYQDGGGHTYTPKDRKHPLDSLTFCIRRSSRGLHIPWITPSSLHLLAVCPLCDAERHSFHFHGTLCCILGNNHHSVSIAVAPVNNFILSNSVQIFERAGHFQDSSDLWIPEFYFVDSMNTVILRCRARWSYEF